ncbi:leucine-rich repeat and IQ domain-containing protein 1 isoform X2 [Micropterus dolomieu]|uniref:leucine-rich repeat and IQ domain-containing protein 1 isoform X2 n=1 Tax=Micropterus dolomieu TaxID=147949 RepID=UPI001E8DD516|nr:leucine-rich repeat and IQ domain-containing protein 1 isoform X2 [Micropterus dolomieu]
MTGANEIYDTIMRELNNLVLSDTDETKEEQESFSLLDEADFDDIPPSLLSYFETSRSRAAVCEKLILEEFEDFESHHTEDMMNVPIHLGNDMMKINEQVACDTQNEDNETSTYTCLLPAPTETMAPFIHNVSVCPSNEDEAGTDEYMESEKHVAFEMRTLEISLNEEERKKSSEYEAEREKWHCEEMKKMEQKRQIERDFQKELKKIMEAEKLHQKELELMQKKAQEKLEQEMLLQQELIRNLRRRVEEERKMREEEQKRMKDKEDKRKREEETERSRMEEERRRKKEEERQMECMTLKNEEEEKRIIDRKEKRKREEERNKIDLEKKKLDDEMRMMKQEEERKMKEEMERLKKEEERKREEERKIIEESRKKLEKEKTKVEEEMILKKEEAKQKKEERKKREEENMRIEEEGGITEVILERKKQVEMRKNKEEEDADDRKKIYKEMRKRDIKEHGNVDEELEEKKKKQESERKKSEEEEEEEEKEEEEEEEENKDGRKREKERKKMEEKTEVKEVVRKREGKHKQMNEELRSIEEDEKRKNEDKRKTKEGNQRRRQEEEMMKQKDEEHYRKSEEEIRVKEEREGYKGCGVDNRKMEHESKANDKEKKQEEKRKRQEEIIKVEAGENKKEGNKKREEEITIKEKEESTKRLVHDREKEERVIRENEWQEKRKKSMIGENEKKNTDKTETSLASQLEDSPPWTSSSPGSLHSESTACPTSTGTVPHQHDLDKISQASIDKTETSLTSQLEDSPTWTSSSPGFLRSESTICTTSTGILPQQHNLDKISQASIDKTVACENQAARPSAVSVFLPMCLPEHTEQKRLSWMNDCIPWSKLCLQNRRKQKGSVQSRRGQRRTAEPSSLPPLCPDSLLQSTGSKSLQEVTTVTLEDLPGCNLSTLAQCIQLRSITLRRCGLKSLEGINQLPQLCHVDVQENDISFVECENMTNLRILRLGHNKMTSIRGLTGAENLDILDLSHNSITRIAGLESMRRLQRLSVDHNQLISTKGLREVYTLLHLSCSHNHLASVEGLENSALLNTLDLRANSLTEPPSLNNQVLLRELHLDDNSISSLTALSACWLPHMQHLSVAQNRITQLPSMSDSVSLANLDLRFNCISELQNVCESLQGCHFLREVHLTGNPLQQESGWRSTLQRAVPGLRAIDKQETDSFLSPPAVQQVSLAIGSFLTFCQAQLQQTHDLQQQHNRELSNASSSLDAVKTSCRHFTEALQLAKDQRFAHEYGDTTVADKCRAAGQATPKETIDIDSPNAEEVIECPEIESTGKIPPVIPDRNNIKCSYWTFEGNSSAESQHETFDNVRTGPKTGPTVSKANSGSVHSLTTKGKTISSNLEMAPVSNHQDLDLQNTAAVVIQQLWRKYRQKCGNISSPSTAEKGGGRGGKPGPSYINRSQDYAATVIQAFWRGFTLRRRLTSALAAVTCLDTVEDDTFEEVDVNEFVFDEASLEKHWTLPLSENSAPRRYPGSEQPLSLKPPGSFPEPSQYISPPPLVRGSKQAWVAGGQVDCASPVGSIRSKYPASASVVCGLSERSEKILEEWGFTNSHTALLMLKRAQKMKSKKQQAKKRRDPIVRLALFKNCSYHLCPVEAPNRQAQYNRNLIKVREVELGLQQAEKTKRAQQWLHTQAAHSDRDSESVHFLPEISSDILNGGRVQLVADSGYTEPLHYASGLWANNSLAAQSCKDNSYPRRNTLNHASKEIPSPKRVTSAPSKKERISFRDNPVQLSGGWGGGKKRDKVYK